MGLTAREESELAEKLGAALQGPEGGSGTQARALPAPNGVVQVILSPVK